MGREKKGFSLFTPLIGTTVIVIAIMISSVMIQNDIKMSRAISSSYQQNAQELDAQLIIAASSIALFNSFKNINEDYVQTIDVSIVCSTQTICYNQLKTNYLTTLDNQVRNNLFTDITSSISRVSNYDSQSRSCPAAGNIIRTAGNCISTAMPQVSQSIDLADNNENYDITLNLVPSSGSLDDFKKNFIVEFHNPQTHDSIALSIYPKNFKYTTTTNIRGKFLNMSQIYIAFESASGGCSGSSYEDCFSSLSSSFDLSDVDISVYKRIAIPGVSSSPSTMVAFEWDEGMKITLKDSSSPVGAYIKKCESVNGAVTSPALGGDCSAVIPF